MSGHELKTKLHNYLESHRPDGEHPNYVMESGEEAFLRAIISEERVEKTGIFPQCTKFVEDAFENGAGIKLYDRIMQDMDNRRPSDVSRWPLHGSETSNGYRYSSLVMHAKDPYDSDNLAAYMRHTHQMIESPSLNAHDFQIGDILFFKKHGDPKMHHVAIVRGIDHNGYPEFAESTAKEISYQSWQTFEHNVHTEGLKLVGVGRLHELSQSHEQSQLEGGNVLRQVGQKVAQGQEVLNKIGNSLRNYKAMSEVVVGAALEKVSETAIGRFFKDTIHPETPKAPEIHALVALTPESTASTSVMDQPEKSLHPQSPIASHIPVRPVPAKNEALKYQHRPYKPYVQPAPAQETSRRRDPGLER